MKKIALGILAHVDAGKTTLCEALMYRSGNIKKLGRVDRKDSFLDNYSLERERGITIFSKQAVLDFRDTRFTLLDTPGHMDFSAETERTLGVLDCAVLVISASQGVQSHTVTLWNLLKRYSVPTFIFVNKTDLESVDTELVSAMIRQKLGDGCIDFSDTDSDEFYENAALCDEKLFSVYDKSGSLSDEDIIEAIQRRKIFPMMFGSALRITGVDEFLDCLDRYTVQPKDSGVFSARVFKIAQDSSKNRLTFFKVTSGKLRVRETLPSEKNINGEKVTQLRLYSGEKFTAVEEAAVGDVCAATGVTFAKAGDGLGEADDTPIPALEPVLSYGVVLEDGVDKTEALKCFKALEEEDPRLEVMWNERAGEISLRLMGEIQSQVLKSILKERFGLNVAFSDGSIIYKETIADTVEGVGHFEPLRHYAEAHLILKPLDRDSGLVIRSECREDMLDKNWQRLILTHLYEKTHIGVLTGSPITDIEITLASGKAHLKHTEGGDFRQAVYRAVRQGLRRARSVLLEPYYDFSLEIPADNIGKAMTDIGKMSGEFSSPEIEGETAVIRGTAPVAEMRNYSKDVARYSHGRGTLSLSFKGYDLCHNSEEVIESLGYDPDKDLDNPCDSVFCSKGAGYTVKWNEAPDHMHLPSALSQRKNDEPAYRERVLSKAASSRDIFALDKELMMIFEQTYGPVKKRAVQEERRRFSAPAQSSDNKRKNRSAELKRTEYVLVDGYNVIFSWDKLKKLAADSFDAARAALVNILCNYQGYKKCELILVFDAYKVERGEREIEQVGGISVVYTKEAETADTYIEKTSHELVKNNTVKVVTSDRMEQLIILGNGAIKVSCDEFLENITQAEQEIREIIKVDRG